MTSRWVDSDDTDGMARLEAFIRSLAPSGGGGAEDAAGGLAAVGRLFEALAEPSLRVCLLLADAPCHGMEDRPDPDFNQRHRHRRHPALKPALHETEDEDEEEASSRRRRRRSHVTQHA